MIGTGASAIQIVPEIQPKVGSLTLFQRTPSWVMPDLDRPVTGLERRLFRTLPFTQRAVRWLIYALQETTVLGTIVDRRLSSLFERIARRHLRRQVPDPELRRKLRPDYVLGCKRITMSNTYFPALTQPNAEVVTEPIAEVTEKGIRTADGAERELDTIVLATGFRVFNNPGMAALKGRGGVSLLDAWNGSPRAYLGTAVAGFPNLFFLVGPNSAGGYNSIIFTSESHINYVAECIREMERAASRRWRSGRRSTTRSPARPSGAWTRASGTRAAARAGTSTRTAATASGGPASRSTSGAAPAASTAAATSPTPA